jgi:vacuolar-type H+-ATPase subunit H
VSKNVPYLKNLVLVSNHFAELADLDGLAGFKRLTHLVLADNPVTKKEHYRYWVLWRCPSVRFLDYQKVKAAEREAAKELFGTEEEPTELASKIMGTKSKAVETTAADITAEPTSKLKHMKLTDAEKKRLKDMIKKADTLEEMIRLETMLKEGRLPAGVHNAGDPMEE